MSILNWIGSHKSKRTLRIEERQREETSEEDKLTEEVKQYTTLRRARTTCKKGRTKKGGQKGAFGKCKARIDPKRAASPAQMREIRKRNMALAGREIICHK